MPFMTDRVANPYEKTRVNAIVCAERAGVCTCVSAGTLADLSALVCF